MSHELRTPLDHLLSDQLCHPQRKPKYAKREFSETIHSSGDDLLVWSQRHVYVLEDGTRYGRGRPDDVALQQLAHYVERTFRHVAESKNIIHDPPGNTQLPKSMLTDSEAVAPEIIKNLLSNAFKFTHRGQVAAHYRAGPWGLEPEHDLNGPASVLFRSPIPASGSRRRTNSKSSSKPSNRLTVTPAASTVAPALGAGYQPRIVGGESRLTSMPARGSTFLYLPQIYSSPRSLRKAATSVLAHHNGGNGAQEALRRSSSSISTAVQSRLTVESFSKSAATLLLSGTYVSPAVVLPKALNTYTDGLMKWVMTAPTSGPDRVLLIRGKQSSFRTLLCLMPRARACEGIVT